MSTRRDFIKTTSLASAGVASALSLNASSYKNILGANDRINVAFMGLGRRVAAYYPCLAPEFNAKLRYLCDVKKSQIDNANEQLKSVIDYIPSATDDIRKVLDDKKVDVVFNAAPDHWHAPGAIMAMDAGKHVYWSQKELKLWTLVHFALASKNLTLGVWEMINESMVIRFHF